MILKGVKFCKAVLLLAVFAAIATAQGPRLQSQEIDEQDGIPVLIKHLPEWENRRSSAVFATKPGDLQAVLGQRPALDQIDFTAGTEAVTASYEAGRLLIIEYTSPQGSVEADQKFSQIVSGDATTAYRRIGNYNVFVFDVTDPVAADTLLEQVKYEKQIQWLGNNPFRISAERAFVITTADIFVSTMLVILMGVGAAIVGGLVSGIVYFRLRERKRAGMAAFTDAGGITRLNLDGFTPDIAPTRLLSK